MQVAKDGIPGQDVVGFEKFDASMLGMSSYVQRIQYVESRSGGIDPDDRAPRLREAGPRAHQRPAR